MTRPGRRCRKKLATLSTQGSQRLAQRAGHMLPIEDPQMIVKAVLDMLAQVKTK